MKPPKQLSGENKEKYVPFKKSDGLLKLDQTVGEHTHTIDEHTQTLKWQGHVLNVTLGFIVAILAVCVIGYITFLRDAWNFHTSSYQEYTKAIDILKEKNDQLKLDQLSTKVDSLQKQLDVINKIQH
jgi:hypothetical protein